MKMYSIVKKAIFVAILLLPSSALAADLGFSPVSATHAVGQTFNIRVEVNPDGEGVNAVEAEVTFDKTKLSVTGVSKTGSAFSLWTTEPEFSNTDGTVNFGGGSPTPFSRTSTLVTITFKAIAPGSAEVDFGTASVLAADGLGTDVYDNGNKSVYTITEPAPQPEPEPEPTPAGSKPPAPVVTSETHPDEDAWYTDNTIEFAWEIPKGVTTVRVLLNDEEEADPTTEYTPPINQRIIDGLNEGISYLHVDFKNDIGYSDTTHRKIQIDQTPPEDFEIVVVEGDDASSTPFLSFQATDSISDIERYEIVVDGGDTEVLTVEQHEALPEKGWEMPLLFDGTYLVVITAYDLAGNSRDSDVSVELATGYVDEREVAVGPVVEEEKPFNIWLYISIFLLIACLALAGIIFMQRRAFLKERDYLRRETKEIRQKMEKIFSVLQDELEEQIRSLDKKPRLSEDEKRVLKSMREALEMSEAFINKEIEDVEKVLQ